MTFLKTTLASAAAIALAAPAFAGDKPMKQDKDYEAKSEAVIIVSETETEVMGATEMHPSKVNDTVGEILQADGEPSIQDDGEIIVEDYTIEEDAFRAADDDGMVADNAIVVPGTAGTLTTVTCPAGTTAQIDMTCLITGEYKPDLID
ncbi:hypothetical protein ACFFUB_08355 [Algimonas porphyrae]|uniref:Uncharacterized protein n=1 Tax=Algimonas porphyrae TaxID=1128113 RepID=A0ABQ5V718_9PROT|nr:hypothetical protein [Algimonas porphyrae]GLQ22057.1 hypothetical protein GCM10007854_30120 [Algimonas porphyrae]